MARSNFGDAQLKLGALMPKVVARTFLMLPVGAVGTALCATVVGSLLGLPLLLWAGVFISKPIRKHPAFNTEITVREGDNG